MDLYNSDELLKALKKLIDLPDEIVELELKLAVGQMPIIEMTTYVKNPVDHQIGMQLETCAYKIVPIK